MDSSFSSLLATDLDGTFLPLRDNLQNQQDLQILSAEFARKGIPIVYVTGRHLASVQRAMQEHRLPTPDWIICDVGTSIYRKSAAEELELVSGYHENHASITQDYPLPKLTADLQAISGLKLQEPEKQGPFKLSFYADCTQLESLVAQIEAHLAAEQAPWSIIHSVDPFNNNGLIDLLPQGVSKAYALQWWSETVGIDPQTIVYAGDSGNDFAAFIAGYYTIVVGNADRQLAEKVREAHQARGYQQRLHLAEAVATSGVLEGCRAFGMI